MPIRLNVFRTRSKIPHLLVALIASFQIACGGSGDAPRTEPTELKITASANAPRPNILMIVVDTLRKDRKSVV